MGRAKIFSPVPSSTEILARDTMTCRIAGHDFSRMSGPWLIEPEGSGWLRSASGLPGVMYRTSIIVAIALHKDRLALGKLACLGGLDGIS